MSKFRVLSLDGGGVRGLLTALLLERLCREPGLEHAFDHVNLIAGNSSGALIALGMAHGLDRLAMLETLVGTRMAFDNARNVFGPPRWRRPFSSVPWVLVTKYRNQVREEAVKKFLHPETRLRDLNTHVLVTSFDLDNAEDIESGRSRGPRMWKPKIFHNFIGSNSDRDIFAWQAALYSTAAITYFPSVDGYADGGIYANNPSMCALAQIFDARYPPKPKPALDDVVMLSVGAGQNLDYVSGPKVRWGLLPWIWKGRFVTVSTDATVGVADYECRQLLSNSNYRRLNPVLETPDNNPIALDDFDQLEFIRGRLDSPRVKQQIEECANWLREHWMAGMNSGPILPEFTSKHVGSATELTCLMPIKPGFLPVLDTRTYATRLRVVFKVLQALRAVSREQREQKPILDIVEAARTVHSFSWAIVQEKYLLLQVTFDRPWEPYIRVVWKDLGPLLDLFLCNCQGFVPSSEGFDAFAGFVRSHQVEANFFYPSSSLTVDDDEYLVELEKLQREGGDHRDHRSTTLVPEGPVERSKKASGRNQQEAIRQWLAVLDVLYGLRMFYPEGSPDHLYLQRAARALLSASRPKGSVPASPALAWLEEQGLERESAPGERRKLDPGQVQGGIQRPYRRITQGCLLLARIDDATKARDFVGALAGEVTKGSDHPDTGGDAKPDDVYKNVAFTFNGLKQLGVKESLLGRFPKEFREGMEARAGLLGDVRENHPENWALPRWKPQVAPALPVPMATVDVVFTLNKVRAKNAADEARAESGWPSAVEEFSGRLRSHGFHVLAEEPLLRLRPDGSPAGQRLTRDHFGFLDGISQPNASDDPKGRDDVELGEIFVGYQNERGDPPFPEASTDSAWVRGSLIDNGSFLVVRKLRQYRAALDEVIEAETTTGKAGKDPERFLAKMVGRTRDGEPLATPHDPDKFKNDFDFGTDPGALCPFHAHIRRGNPRLSSAKAGDTAPLVPRIARRSLVYGQRFDGTDDANRGVMFMAYNASIAEQFEILQRWMSGGNTPAGAGNSAVYSGQPDPLLGLPEPDGKRIYRFVDDDGEVRHVDLGKQPFVTLQWGLYLFAPSIPALKLLAREDSRPDVDMALAAISLGEQIIRKLETEADWAAALEDASMNLSGATAAVLTAIRKAHDGVYRTPYGVIVADHDLAMHVLKSDAYFSVKEYQNRFARSVGESYLGLDGGREYQKLSKLSNDTLKTISKDQAFNEAHAVTDAELRRAIRVAVETADQVPGKPEDRWLPVPLEPVVDYVLAKLAQMWFDIPDDRLIRVGGRPAPNSDAVHCPFSFLAPSRYVFSSPNPRDTVTELGEANGQRLLDKARLFVAQCRQKQKDEGETGLNGEISKALFESITGDDDLLARTLLGLVFGFVPTVYGTALQVVSLWLGDNRLWRIQQRLLSARSDDRCRSAACLLREEVARAMLTRPVPPLLHRRVTSATTLGKVALNEGDRVVVGMLGVTQQVMLEQKKLDIMPIFGGDRNQADRPIHACPGYDIAMGVLLGMLTAIVEVRPIAPAAALTTIRVPNPQFQ